MEDPAEILSQTWAALRHGAALLFDMAQGGFAGIAARVSGGGLAPPRDIATVLTVVGGAVAIPAILAARVEGRPPLVGATVLLGAAALGLWTWLIYPGWTFQDIPMAFVEVLARLLD